MSISVIPVLIVLFGVLLSPHDAMQSSLEVKTEAERIVRDIRQIAAFLHRKSCSTTIILQAVLPSADQYNNIWPNR